MNQKDIDAVNASSAEQGHRLRLEEGCLDPTMPSSEVAYTNEEEMARHIFGTQLQNVADKVNGTIIYQTILNSKGEESKRIIIEYSA